MNDTLSPARPKGLHIALWLAQLAVGIPFVLIGYTKLHTPIAELSKMFPWPGQVPEWFVRLTGVIDMAGGLGMVLPGLTRIRPGLTWWAALGCVALQICAVIFHVSRGEIGVTPLNFAFLALSAFVLWGRSSRALLGASR